MLFLGQGHVLQHVRGGLHGSLPQTPRKWGGGHAFSWAWTGLQHFRGRVEECLPDHNQRSRLRSMGFCLTITHGNPAGILACIKFNWGPGSVIICSACKVMDPRPCLHDSECY